MNLTGCVNSLFRNNEVSFRRVQMADPAPLARSISVAVSRAISETVNAVLAQVGN